MPLPRRQISEIETRYALEPTLRDYFVEGYFDLDLLECARNKLDPSGSQVFYPIDSVDIPIETLTSHGFTEGQKQRVVALAIELEKLSVSGEYRLIADADLDHWYNQCLPIPNLIYTQYSDIESYFFKEEIIREILVSICGCKIEMWPKFWASLNGVLHEMYILRLSAKDISPNIRWFDPTNYLRSTSGLVNFDLRKYRTELLRRNGTPNLSSAIEEAFSRWNKYTSPPSQATVRGHDLIFLLMWSVTKFRGVRSFATIEAMPRLLFAFIDLSVGVHHLIVK